MKHIIGVFFLSCLLLSSCGDKKLTELHFKIVPTFGDQTLQMNEAVQDENGLDVLRLEGQFHFYLSNLKLVSANGSEAVEDEVILFDLLDEEHNPVITKVKPGAYTAIEFGLGVDEQWNHNAPGDFDNEHPLGSDHSGNNWAWDPGYIFYRIEGFYSTNNDGRLDSTFSYHIGTDELFKTVSIPKSLMIEEGSPAEISIFVDLKKVLMDEGGMDLLTENKSRSMGEEFPIAQKFVNLIAENIE